MNTGRVMRAAAMPSSPARLSLLMIVCGMLAFGTPLFAPGEVVESLSWLLILIGIAQVFYIAATIQRSGGVQLILLGAGLYLGAGVWLQVTPLNSVAALVLLLSLFFSAASLLDILAYLSSAKDHRSPGILLSALATLLLTVFVWNLWPTNPIWALAIVVGAGITLMGAGRLLRSISVFSAYRCCGHNTVRS